MFATGCDTGTNSSTKDTIYIGSGDGKEFFEVSVRRDTTNGTYEVSLWNSSGLYPLPKFLINGIETENNYYHPNSIGLEKYGVLSGDLTYSIIWNGDTLTRTINLPNNTYLLTKGTIGNDSLFVVSGGNGNEKVIWGAYKFKEGKSEYIRDTLPINNNFIFPNDYRFSHCLVTHKDFKLLNFGHTATAETKKIAVWENIRLWDWYQM
jgi:hypothetical protein